MADFGDVLMAMHEKKENQKKAKELKNEVKLLKRRHRAGLKRNADIIEDINADTVRPSSCYRLPLSVLPETPNIPEDTPVLVSEELSRLRDIGLTKQRLEGHALTHGVTCWEDTNGQQVLTFDPYVRGRHFGPYELRLKIVNGKIIIKGHSLPHSVPTQELYRQELAKEGHTGAAVVRPLALTLAKHLRAGLSRQMQVDELKDVFKNELKDLSFINHGTSLNFSLDVSDVDTNSCLQLVFTLLYDRDGERPRTVSCNFKNSESADAELDKQCSVFYSLSLTEAVHSMFE